MEDRIDIVRMYNQLQFQSEKEEIRACNDVASQFGLVLTENDINELIGSRVLACKNIGRIEFGNGILPQMIYAFCDSPYLDQDNYVNTLVQLQEAFYYYKSEAEERFTDEEIVDFMVRTFHGRAQGSLEYLIETSLADLCRYARCGSEEDKDEKEGDFF